MLSTCISKISTRYVYNSFTKRHRQPSGQGLCGWRAASGLPRGWHHGTVGQNRFKCEPDQRSIITVASTNCQL